MSEPRTWSYLAARGPAGWSSFCADRTTWDRGGRSVEPVPVTLVEDPDGDHLGWVPTEQPDRMTMVQRRSIFDVQFTGGSQESVAKGKGEVVGLRVET